MRRPSRRLTITSSSCVPAARMCFSTFTTPKFAAQAIKKISEIGWKPLHLLNNVSASIGSVMKPAGFEHGQTYLRGLSRTLDPQWKDDAEMKTYYQFLEKDFPEGNRADGSVMVGYNVARTLVEVLRKCGDDLTRENVMKQAASLKNFSSGTLLPGITINTNSDDFAPIQKV